MRPSQKWYREEYLKSDHWQKVRAAALKRAGYKCQKCHARNVKLDPHHIRYRLWHEKPRDLIVLCRSCHERRHAAPVWGKMLLVAAATVIAMVVGRGDIWMSVLYLVFGLAAMGILAALWNRRRKE